MTGQWLQGMQDFDLFIAYRISIEGDGGFHGDQGEQLEHVVLQHDADGSCLFIVCPATFQADILSHGDLYVVDIAPVPHGFKNAVCQAKDQDILHSFFAEVVIDAIHLFLSKDSCNLAVKLSSRGQIMPKGLFDDNTRPTLAVPVQASRAKVMDDFRVLAGRRRGGKDAIASSTALLVERIQDSIELLIAL